MDVVVDELDLAELGFSGVDPEATGRPSYHPSILLKLYSYGYLNRVQSSRRLEREAGRNVEVMWLTGRLVPDHKTIADFRKDNGRSIRQVCVRFVAFCRTLGLLTQARGRDRRQQVQGGQQSRQELHGAQTQGSNGTARAEHRALLG
jgi:transposase